MILIARPCSAACTTKHQADQECISIYRCIQRPGNAEKCMEKQNDVSNTINRRTSVKLPLTFIASCLVGIAVSGWAQFQAHQQYDIKRFAEVYQYIERKAADRYSGTEARQFAQSIEQRFKDEQRANSIEHRSIQRQLDHHEKEINRIKQ